MPFEFEDRYLAQSTKTEKANCYGTHYHPEVEHSRGMLKLNPDIGGEAKKKPAPTHPRLVGLATLKV